MNRQAFEHSLEFIDSWLEFRYRHESIPGYTVAIAYKDEILFQQSYGYADLEKKTKLTPQHLFRIASHSKTFTATAIMQLQEQGKLRIDDYAADYLVWLKEHSDKRWQKVTIRQLLSHAAGVIRDGLNADYWQLEREFPDSDDLKKEVLEAKLVIDNNTRLKYSNYGYSLLGLIVAEVSGQSYNDFVTKHIIKSLGLHNTGAEYSPEISKRLVIGYSREDIKNKRWPIANISTKAMSPATGFSASAADLCKYFLAHKVGNGLLLNDESKKEMQRTQWHLKRPGSHDHEDYGLGMGIDYVGKRRTVGHGGAFPGQSTKSMFDPSDEISVIVLTNCIDGPASSIAKGIFGIIDYFQKSTPTKTPPKHKLSHLEGRYMDLWMTINVVVTGDKVVTAYPNNWEPLSHPEKLEYVNDTTFKTVDTDSYDGEGELVLFNLSDGKVKTVIYNGATMWPEEEWLKRLQDRTRIG